MHHSDDIVSCCLSILLEPTPIDITRIDLVSKIPIDSSPLAKIVDEENLAALCDILRFPQHQHDSFQPSWLSSSSSPAGTIDGLAAESASLLLQMESKCNVGKVADYSSHDSAGSTFSWSDDGIQRLRKNVEQELSFGAGGGNSFSSERHVVRLNFDPATRNLSSYPRTSEPCSCDIRTIIPAESKSFGVEAPTAAFGKEFSENRENNSGAAATRFRINQTEQWYQRYLDLAEFRKKYGHCLVPLNWPENPALAHWVKRQRQQYRIKQEHKDSTLTPERQRLLEQVGFVWDSHASVWEQRFKELQDFKETYGHCRVPKTYSANPQVAIWVKCQRRQFKLYTEGRNSNMTIQRIRKLQKLGFVFFPRGKKEKQLPSLVEE